MLNQLKIKSAKIYDYFINLRYDQKFSIETNIPVKLLDMDIDHQSIIHARQYQATHYRLFFKIMNQLQLNWKKFTFIDFGSGKGRCLLIAGMLGFKEAIGIEFAEDLCQKSRENLQSFKKAHPHVELSPIKIIKEDALNFYPYSNHNVYFFYNPFDGNIMEKVLQNCVESSNSESRDYYIYINPLRDYLFESFGLKEVMSIPNLNHNKKVKIYTNINLKSPSSL